MKKIKRKYRQKHEIKERKNCKFAKEKEEAEIIEDYP